MKKIFTSTISGIIFNIEDDAFEKLNAYLNSLHRYFSTYPDSFEIIQDIESRIAEIFLTKINPEKQAITLEDVESLITVMGSISDFEAEEAFQADDTKAEGQNRAQNNFQESKEGKRSGKLLRDAKRKILGGVASGLASYFGIDTLWLRLCFVVVATGMFMLPALTGLSILIYLALWISMPASNEIPDDPGLKRFFRNPDKKVLAGVASGISSYTKTDVAVIRLLFVISILMFGSGLLLYLVLWAITPLANSITDRIQMEGQPVTIHTIERKIKTNLNEDMNAEESGLAKLLLLPFRIISGILSALKPLAKFVLEAFRVLGGMVLTFTGLVFIAVMLLIGLMLSEIIPFNDSVVIDDIPVRILAYDLNPFMVIGAIGSIFIPALVVCMLGLGLILKRNIFKTYITMPLAGIWVLSVMMFVVYLPGFVKRFRSEGEFTTSHTLGIKKYPLYIKLKKTDYDTADGCYKYVSLTLKPSFNDSIKLNETFKANGTTRREGERNARTILYGFSHSDSVITIGSHFALERHARYFGQELNLVLYIPVGKEFKMDPILGDVLSNTLYPAGYNESDLDSGRWVFNGNSLKCINCKPHVDEWSDNIEEPVAPEAPQGPDTINLPDAPKPPIAPKPKVKAAAQKTISGLFPKSNNTGLSFIVRALQPIALPAQPKLQVLAKIPFRSLGANNVALNYLNPRLV
jgi:phage shock protein PspC (stress-responsive transcriptional regulator)